MAYTKYSLTPANNTAAPPDGAPEGMLPSAVNDTMRDMMAQIRDAGDGIRNGTYTMTAPVITGGSITGVALSGNTLTNPVITGGSINNTPIGATTASTGRFSDLTDTGLTSGRVIYAGTGGNLVDDADFTFNGTTVTMANDASISGLTVGKGGGAVASNTVAGFNALNGNSTGANNTAIGYQSLLVATGSNSTAIGYNTGRFVSSGQITALGSFALYNNTTGTANTGVGGNNGVVESALQSNTTGSYNIAVGTGALYSNTTASNNTAVGYQSLYANTTGTRLTAVGRNALLTSTTASDCAAFGDSALGSNTTGADNCAFGRTALLSNTTGFENTAMGYQALYSNTTASYNTAVGRNSLLNCTTGAYNTVIGHNSGDTITTGSKNSILGRYNGNQGGLDIRTASNYIVLSDGDGNPRLISDATGDILIGKTVTGDAAGITLYPNGTGYFVRSSGNVLEVNRLTTDGTLILFAQDSTNEGSISVSGTTVSYNGGHLSRWSHLPSNQKDETLLKGTVMSNLDDMCVWTKDGEVLPNEQLNKMKVSDVEGDTNVAGVFVNWTFDEDCNSDDMNIAMTGDMIIRIADGVVVQKGDLLMSAGDGTAKPQGDDIVRSKTIAKVTSNYVTCTYADGSYCVPCVLMAC